MPKTIILALLLACVPAMAVADAVADAIYSQQFSTERGTLTALAKALDGFDAAMPALTPEQQEYVKGEEAFRLAEAGQLGIGGTPGNRVTAYTNSKEFYLSIAHNSIKELRHDLVTVKALAGKPERFALWSNIVVRMSFPSALENAVSRLRKMGVISANDLGLAQGVSWGGSPSADQAQVIWPFWAETMWVSWCYDGVVSATGASKLLVRHPR
jgi:hypothetical protein